MRKHVALRHQDDEHQELPIQEAIELARGHHIAGNYVIAERTYHDVLRAVPDNPTTNHLLGAMYFQLGNIEKALHYMKISIEISPEEKQYWSNYGSVYYMTERYEESLECYDKALEIDPAHIETLNRKSLALWQKQDFEQAEKIARQSLDIMPDNLEGLINLGLSLAKQEKFEDANEIWKKSHEKYPEDVRTLSNWANMLRETHQPKQAEALAHKALMVDPNDTDALNNLGCALRDMGRSKEAIEIFEKATNIRPKNYKAHANKSLAYNDLAQYEQAAIAARYAVDFQDDYAPAYNALSTALVEIGEFSQAHYAAQRAVQLAPDDAEPYLNLADVLYLSSCFDDGHAALKEALKRDPDNPRAYAKLSSIYERLDEADDALWAIDKAIELSPDTPMFLARKASILHISNDIERALECVDQALEMNPDLMPALISKAEILIAVNRIEDAEEVLAKAKKVDENHPLIYFTTASIKKFKTEDDEDFQKMLSLQENVESMGTVFSSSLNYAIAKGYETQKQYNKAFEYLNKANSEKRRTLPYDANSQKDVFESMKADFLPRIIEAFKGKGYNSEKPVFIVGMPRSGTTLTEQIISSHPEVFGAGELPDVMRTKRRMGDITPDNLEEAGKLYVELSSARDKSGKAKRITDKMPGNYMNIGLIATMLPKAKIIHCRRNPMDTCLSNYKQNFMVGQYWSYDLEEMGQEYLRYLDMMEYWHAAFPSHILDIDYEDTVNDLESQARKFIDYVGLEWNDACLEPHKQKRSVLTASKSQVTQPVYKTSVEKWKVYEEQMQPLYNIISSAS